MSSLHTVDVEVGRWCPRPTGRPPGGAWRTFGDQAGRADAGCIAAKPQAAVGLPTPRPCAAGTGTFRLGRPQGLRDARW